MRFHGRVATDRDYNGLALDVTEGERIAHALNGKDIAFLSNHGVIVCGERIDYAFDDLYYLERACESQLLAMSTGRRLRPVSAELASAVAAQMEGERQQSELLFAALKRLL
jgi:ribulose-5-phosphate 4-epimerase/fuculose-1-phosphate aldolase